MAGTRHNKALKFDTSEHQLPYRAVTKDRIDDSLVVVLTMSVLWINLIIEWLSRLA